MDVKDGKILIVDDVAENLKLLQRILRERGYTVYPANTGEAALRFLQVTLPDVILLDAMMPNMDGYEVCRRLREDGRTRDIPVIFISAADRVFDKVRAFSCGAVDYIVKPFQQEEVLARIQTHLALRDLQKRLEMRVRERTAELTEINARLSDEIAERKRTEEALSLTRQDYKSLVDSINGIIWELELDAPRFTYVSRQATTLLGYPQSAWLESTAFWTTCLHPEDRESLVDYYRTAPHRDTNHDIEHRMITADGKTVWFRNIFNVIIEDDAPARLRGVMVDVTQQKTAAERLHYLAHYDALTGLPNRELLCQHVQQAIIQARQGGHKFALLFIDLDFFKNINDSLGHQIGDALLKEAASRLQAREGKNESAARLGGDEFVLLMKHVGDSQEAAALAARTLECLSVPYFVDDHELHSTASIGIGIYPDDGEDVDTLMRITDTAMYDAKDKGRNTYRFFTSALNIAVQNRILLESGLRQALVRDEFMLYYQPQVDLKTDTIYAAEALLRWKKPNGDIVSAGEFVTVAEESGLILPIGEWALREACTQLKQWRDNGFPQMRIAVNLSPRQFYQPGFQHIVARILDDLDLPASALELEITESMLMQPGEDNLNTLAKLYAMGVHLALDDFGVGYSCLSYLRRFPVSVLKIDRSFVNGIGRRHSDTEIVTAIIAMAHSLQLSVIAEGVEHQDQLDFLRDQKCDAVQGYYFSKPVPPDAFAALLRQRTPASPT